MTRIGVGVVATFGLSLVFLAGTIRVGADGDWPVFHIDEAHKLAESYYYHLYFETRDWSHEAWKDDFFARVNPPVAKYVFGASLALRGLHLHDAGLQQAFNRLWRSPGDLRARVDERMLLVTRQVSAFFGALVCALAFWMAARLAGPVAGIVAVGLLLGDPTFVVKARSGLTDTLLLFHLALMGPVAWQAVRAQQRYLQVGLIGFGETLRWSLQVIVLPGVVIALAAGTKLNGAITGPIYALALVAGTFLFLGRTGWSRRALWSTGLAIGLSGCAAFGLFVLLNPSLHDEPVRRSLELLDVYRDWMLKQQLDPGGGVFEATEKIVAAAYATLLGEQAGLARLLGIWGSSLGVLGFLLGLGVAVGGLVSRAGDLGRRAAPAVEAPRAEVALWVWLAVVPLAVLTWLPLTWPRYFLPVGLAFTIVTAVGLANVPRGARLFGSALAAGGGRSVLAGALAIGLLGSTAALVAGPWPLDPTRLDPRARRLPRSLSVADYERAARVFPDSARRQRHLAAVLERAGRIHEAARAQERVLELLSVDSEDTDQRVQRALALDRLAGLQARLGMLRAAEQSRREHVRVLEQLQRGLQSSDPWVEQSFAELIALRSD